MSLQHLIFDLLETNRHGAAAIDLWCGGGPSGQSQVPGCSATFCAAKYLIPVIQSFFIQHQLAASMYVNVEYLLA